MRYWRFVATHPRFLAFGFSMAFFSSFGQTFFIALSGGHIRDEFGLSDGAFGLCYSLATLSSGLTIIWLGRLIDRVDLRPFAATIGAGLGLACLGMATASAVPWLVLALYLLRLTGQGLLSHTQATSMARYFEADRGKAMSVTGLGYPAGEALLPIVAVLAMERYGWRPTWLAIGVGVLVVVIPLLTWLLRGHTLRHRDHVERLSRTDADPGPGATRRQWTRDEVLRDPRFYLVLPAVIAPGFIVTGLFFHQVHLVEAKGWNLTWFAGSFAVFAATQLPAALTAGPLVDRVGGTRLLPVILLPLSVSLAVLASGNHPAVAVAFMLLAGITSGLTGTVVGSMWAEAYGVRHLGAIRALVTAILVFGTAVSPVAMGGLIDAGVSMEAIAWMCFGYTLVGTMLAAVAVRR